MWCAGVAGLAQMTSGARGCRENSMQLFQEPWVLPKCFLCLVTQMFLVRKDSPGMSRPFCPLDTPNSIFMKLRVYQLEPTETVLWLSLLIMVPRWLSSKESAWSAGYLQQMQVWSLGWEDLLEKEIATHFSILAWKIPKIEEPGGLHPWGLFSAVKCSTTELYPQGVSFLSD